jgi:hypothetical protein
LKIHENIATALLGVWLIAVAVISLSDLNVPLISKLLPLVALAAGILFLLGSGKLTKSIGVFILGVWLILRGLTPFLYVKIPYYALIIDALAVIAGIFLILRK